MAGHRPFPPPDRPWILHQEWRDLLFAHWACEPDAIARLIPGGLTLDTRDGAAWIGVVPFLMTGVRLRWLPPMPTAHTFLELNVRTYVVHNGVPGVWFFSLDAASRLAVIGARRAYHLPYFHSAMTRTVRSGTSTFTSHRRPAGDARFTGQYRPGGGPEFTAQPGSLEAFLVERYCLYTRDDRGRLLRADVDHPPWRLRTAEATLDARPLCLAAGIELPPTPPLLHYASVQQVRTWWPLLTTTAGSSADPASRAPTTRDSAR